MSAPRLPLAMLLGALALPVAGCGSADQGLLTPKQASKLRAELEDARRAVDDDPQRCKAARSAAQRGSEKAAQLPARVDEKLQRNLQQGFNHLVDQVNQECGADKVPKKTPTPTPTATPEEETPTPTPTPEET